MLLKKASGKFFSRRLSVFAVNSLKFGIFAGSTIFVVSLWKTCLRRAVGQVVEGGKHTLAKYSGA
jgi:hypothetical protein